MKKRGWKRGRGEPVGEMDGQKGSLVERRVVPLTKVNQTGKEQTKAVLKIQYNKDVNGPLVSSLIQSLQN